MKKKEIIKCVRNWLNERRDREKFNTIPSAINIYNNFLEFKNKLPELCSEPKWVEEELTYSEYTSLVINWITLEDSTT
jgi:hypothetical protein